jgi:hypothetical protein
MKPTLKAPGTKRLEVQYDELLPNFAFNLKLRRYAMSSYLDLQLLYGCSAEECAKIRTGAAGKIMADAVVGPGRY